MNSMDPFVVRFIQTYPASEASSLVQYNNRSTISRRAIQTVILCLLLQVELAKRTVGEDAKAVNMQTL